MAKKIIKQPTVEEQQMLKGVTSADVSLVEVRGKAWKAEWIKNGTLDYVSRVMLGSTAGKAAGTVADADAYGSAYEKDPVNVGAEENKVACKCAALLRLNGYWSIKMWYWLVWRWFYYVKQYTNDELYPYLEECKKKVPVMSYLMCTTLLTAMMDTKKQMNRAEVNRIQAEQLSAQRAALEKNTPN